MKKLLTSLLVSIASLTVTAPAVMAYNYWGEYVGDVWVSEWTVESTNSGTTVFADVSLPTCNSMSQLLGSVRFDYYSNDGGYMTGYSFNVAGYEGHDGWISVRSNSVMSTDGTLYLTDNTYCGPLNVNTDPIDWGSIGLPW